MTVLGWEIKKTERLKKEVIQKHNLAGSKVVAVRTSKTENGIKHEYYPLNEGKDLRELISTYTKLTPEKIDEMLGD